MSESFKGYFKLRMKDVKSIDDVEKLYEDMMSRVEEGRLTPNEYGYITLDLWYVVKELELKSDVDEWCDWLVMKGIEEWEQQWVANMVL